MTPFPVAFRPFKVSLRFRTALCSCPNLAPRLCLIKQRLKLPLHPHTIPVPSLAPGSSGFASILFTALLCAAAKFESQHAHIPYSLLRNPLPVCRSSIFLLIFVAHLLGCAYTYMLNYEPDLNWLVGRARIHLRRLARPPSCRPCGPYFLHATNKAVLAGVSTMRAMVAMAKPITMAKPSADRQMR